jgi:hypothetical protein
MCINKRREKIIHTSAIATIELQRTCMLGWLEGCVDGIDKGCCVGCDVGCRLGNAEG